MWRTWNINFLYPFKQYVNFFTTFLTLFLRMTFSLNNCFLSSRPWTLNKWKDRVLKPNLRNDLLFPKALIKSKVLISKKVTPQPLSQLPKSANKESVMYGSRGKIKVVQNWKITCSFAPSRKVSICFIISESTPIVSFASLKGKELLSEQKLLK